MFTSGNDITVKGEGTLDLSGSSFYHMDRPSEVTTVGPAITEAHRAEAPRTYEWRVNQPVFFHQCTQVRWDGVTIIDAPCWTLSFNQCSRLQLTNLTIENSLVIPNNDVIDLAPGASNLPVPHGPPAILCRNASVTLEGVTNGSGRELKKEMFL